MRPASSTSNVVFRTADAPWSFRIRELWHHREVLYFLAWRDVKVRYKQTALGVAWVILQPLAVALMLTLFLGRLVHTSSTSLPYLLFAFSGMVVWQLFSNILTESSNSVTANGRLVGKVYFPRIAIPLSVVLSSLPDFLISLCVLVFMLAYFHVVPHFTFLLAPVFIILDVSIALGAGLWLAALNVRYRDVRYTLNLLVQVWFFATPVAYPIGIVPARWHLWYLLNPLVGVVEGFRWMFAPAGPLPLAPLVSSGCIAAFLLLTGLLYFAHTEDTFADFI